MPITVTCDECSETYRVRDDAVGKLLKCKGFGRSLKIEAPADSVEEFSMTEAPAKTSTTTKFAWMATAIVIAALAALPARAEYRNSRSVPETVKVFCLVGSFLGVLVLAPVGIVRNQRIDKQRKRDIRRISAKLGLGLDRFQLMTLGRFPLLTNLKYGKSDDLAVAVFDYQYVLQGKPNIVVCQSVVSLRRRGTKLPDFAIRPTAGSWADRDVLELFTGSGDINFKSHPAFSRQYLLRGHDEEAIRKLFTDDVRNFFEQTSGLIVEVEANKLLCYRNGVSVEPADRRSFINEVLQLLSLLQPGLRNVRNPLGDTPNGLDRGENDGAKRQTGSPESPARTDSSQPKRQSLGDRIACFVSGLGLLIGAGTLVVVIATPLFRDGFPREWGQIVVALVLLPIWLLSFAGVWLSLLLLRSSIFSFKEPDLRVEPGAPQFAADSLVCQWSPLGLTLAVIVDDSAGLIHFKRCHRPHVRQRFWMIRPQAWWSCPLSDVLKTRRETVNNRGGSTQNLIIETRTGTVSVSAVMSNFESLCEYFTENLSR